MSELNLATEQRMVQLQEENRRIQEEIAAATERLNSLKQQMDQNKAEIMELRGVRICPNCGSEVEKEAAFCGECGMRMEPVEQADENSVICSRCGMKNSKERKFCAVCGQKLSEEKEAKKEEKVQKEEEAQKEKAKEVEEAQKEEAQKEKGPELAAAEEAEDLKAMETGVVIHCPKCGCELPSDAQFCEECGAKIISQEAESVPKEWNQEQEEENSKKEELLFCRECGNKLEPDSLFCPECGTKVKME